MSIEDDEISANEARREADPEFAKHGDLLEINNQIKYISEAVGRGDFMSAWGAANALASMLDIVTKRYAE